MPPNFPSDPNLTTEEYVRQYIRSNHLKPDPCSHEYELDNDPEFARCKKCGQVISSFSLEGS